jgi:hypothetical protein
MTPSTPRNAQPRPAASNPLCVDLTGAFVLQLSMTGRDDQAQSVVEFVGTDLELAKGLLRQVATKQPFTVAAQTPAETRALARRFAAMDDGSTATRRPRPAKITATRRR